METLLNIGDELSCIQIFVLGLYCLTFYAPVAFASIEIWLRRSVKERRMLFLVVSVSLSYGALISALMTIELPLLFAVYALGPIAEPNALIHKLPPLAWFAPVVGLVADWWYLATPAVAAVLGWFTVRWLAPRWHKITMALNG